MHNKQEIIKRLFKNTAEIITREEFETRLNGDFLNDKRQLNHYIGFEISGYVHIGQGIMSALVMKDLIDLGVKCTVWLADWHTAINGKLDGTKETAARIGQGYFKEAIKACLLAVGADPEKVEFRLASEWYSKDSAKYWEIVTSVMRNTTLARLQRSISIMGKKEGEGVDAATLMYPAMQVADIFYQDIDIAHSGMDQRKAHVMMRDVAEKLQVKNKPMVIHHPLLLGLFKTISKEQSINFNLESNLDLEEEQYSREEVVESLKESLKMSKSKNDSAIWIHDEADVIKEKIKKSYCPEGTSLEAKIFIKENLIPILDWTKHILFWNRDSAFVINRKEEHGGTVEFATYEQLEKSFADGEIHPMDLKNTVAKEIVDLLAPVREQFEQAANAAKKAELDKVLANR